MVGAPGSGKSTFTSTKMKDYVRVNNDTYKNKEKCGKVCRENLEQGKSVVIDNTNHTKDVRKHYIQIAKEFEVPIRCFYMTTDKPTCMHNNFMRKANVNREHMSKAVPAIAIHTFFKNYAEPTLAEGFESVLKIQFVTDSFQNELDK